MNEIEFTQNVIKLIDAAKVYICKFLIDSGKEFYSHMNDGELAAMVSAVVNEIYFEEQVGKAAEYRDENLEIFQKQVEGYCILPHLNEIISSSLMLKAFIVRDDMLKELCVRRSLESNPHQKEYTYNDVVNIIREVMP